MIINNIDTPSLNQKILPNNSTIDEEENEKETSKEINAEPLTNNNIIVNGSLLNVPGNEADDFTERYNQKKEMASKQIMAILKQAREKDKIIEDKIKQINEEMDAEEEFYHKQLDRIEEQYQEESENAKSSYEQQKVDERRERRIDHLPGINASAREIKNAKIKSLKKQLQIEDNMGKAVETVKEFQEEFGKEMTKMILEETVNKLKENTEQPVITDESEENTETIQNDKENLEKEIEDFYQELRKDGILEEDTKGLIINKIIE